MVLNCACRCVLLILNSLTFAAGVALLIVGALMVWGQSVVHGFLGRFLIPLLKLTSLGDNAANVSGLVERILTASGPLGLTVFSFGAAIAILSVIGYVGACCNNKCILKLYAIIIGIMALGILLAVIIGFAKKDAIGDLAANMFKKSVVAYVSIATNNVDSLVISLFQPPLECCGFESPADFVNKSTTDTYGGQSYTQLANPIPCCRMDSDYKITGINCPSTFTANNSYIDTPCRQPVKDVFMKYMQMALYGLIAVFVILIGLLIFTILTIKIDLV